MSTYKLQMVEKYSGNGGGQNADLPQDLAPATVLVGEAAPEYAAVERAATKLTVARGNCVNYALLNANAPKTFQAEAKFMKETKWSDCRKNLARALAVAGVAVGVLCWNSGGTCRAQTPPANLSPGLQEVIKLTQAKMGDDVIIAYIKNSGTSYSLSADDLLYLNSQGVSQPVISTLLQAKSAADTAPVPASAPAPVATPPVAPPTDAQNYPPPSTPAPGPAPGGSPEINSDYFHAQLAPYGSWTDMPGYGPCFSPRDAATPGWRPYCDGGHWVYTDDGWFWQSDYPWGEIAFHYGRWLYTVDRGWLWVPGYDYAPAWVCWRHAEAEGYCGWAPLPPGAVFTPGVGLFYNGRLALDIDFGLNSTFFTFVPFDHFWDHDFRRFVAPRDFVTRFYRHSVVLNNYHVVGGRFVIEGLGHERIGAWTHRDVRVEHVTMHDDRISRHAFDHRVDDHGRYGGHEEEHSRGGYHDGRDDHR